MGGMLQEKAKMSRAGSGFKSPPRLSEHKLRPELVLLGGKGLTFCPPQQMVISTSGKRAYVSSWQPGDGLTSW